MDKDTKFVFPRYQSYVRGGRTDYRSSLVENLVQGQVSNLAANDQPIDSEAVVKLAFDLADRMCAEYERRGWCEKPCDFDTYRAGARAMEVLREDNDYEDDVARAKELGAI